MIRQSYTTCIVALLAAFGSGLAHAQQQPPPSCAGAEYRAFDFWVGDWEVRNPQGQLVGINRVTRAYGGCVLHENWQSMTSGHTGSSFNIYDRTTRQWHQTWVDNTGLLLQLDGGVVDGKMVLRGEGVGQTGAVIHRITWEPVAQEHVRQLWETSADNGATWTIAFDGRYSPSK